LNIHRPGADESETKVAAKWFRFLFFLRGEGGAFYSLPQLSQMNGGLQ